MEFENTFDVDAPIEEVWKTLLDVERVAPCVPGAEVLEQTGDDSYKVAIKVRVGPMSMQYKGDIDIVDTDPGAHRANMRARAREARGQGTANADVLMALSEEGGRTHGTIKTDVQLSGRVASMGRGIIQDVSAKIVDQFSANLEAMLSGPSAPAEPPSGDGASEPAPAPGAAQSVQPDAPSQGTQSTTQASQAYERSKEAPPRQAPAADAELSAMELVVAVAAGRLKDPRTAGGLLAVVVLIAFLLGRRSAN